MRIDRNVSALVEGIPAHGWGRFSTDTDRHQDLAFGRALSDRVIEDVCQPNVVVRSDRDAVGAREHLLVTPAVEELAAAIEDDHRGLATVEHKDVALRVDADARDIVRPLIGHLAPFLDQLVKEITTAGLKYHQASPRLPIAAF